MFEAWVAYSPKSSSAVQEVDETKRAGASARATAWPPLPTQVHGVPPSSHGQPGMPSSGHSGAPGSETRRLSRLRPSWLWLCLRRLLSSQRQSQSIALGCPELRPASADPPLAMGGARPCCPHGIVAVIRVDLRHISRVDRECVRLRSHCGPLITPLPVAHLEQTAVSSEP